MGLCLAVTGVLALGTGCSRDEASSEHCGQGAKCAPWSVVQSKHLLLICMTVVPSATELGAVMDSAATISLSGRTTSSVARAALLDGKVVPGFYILTPAEPTCREWIRGASASAVAYDASSYSVSVLDRLLHG